MLLPIGATVRCVIVPAEWVRELQGEAVALKRWNPYQPCVPAYEAARDDTAIAEDRSTQSAPNSTAGVQS